MNAFSKLVTVAAITLSSVTLAVAQDSHQGAHDAPTAHAGHAAASDPVQQRGAAGQMADGEVKKVEKETAKITIRHGELKNLGMPAMTMVFRAKDPAMLEQVKAGDKVKFVAENVNGTLTVVQIENVK
jgi:Cu/Ag efflux protein CusF